MRNGLGLPALLLVVMSIGACSEAEPAPTGGETGTPSAAESGESSASGEASPTPSETGGVAPASGDVLETDHVSARVPKSYRAEKESVTGTFISADEPGLGGFIALLEKPVINTDLTLRERAERSAENSEFTTEEPPRVADSVTVDGVDLYHITGPSDEDSHYDEYGGVVGDLEVVISFEQPYDYPKMKRQRVIRSVLASMTWK